MKVGAVGLFEAGNLGDDLILTALIGSARDCASLATLSFGELVPAVSHLIERRAAPRGLRAATLASRVFEDCDAIIVGGGGLIQTDSHPRKPYHWLRYLSPDRSKPVLGVGLGLGPVGESWQRRLRERPSPFSRLAVRDADSLRLAKEWNWSAELSSDFVTTDLVRSFASEDSSASTSRTLGIALRAWPGLDVGLMARHIEDIASKTGASKVSQFVLEAKGGQGNDVDFALALQTLVGGSVTVYAGDIGQIIGVMQQCIAGVSMKLHSSVIWDALGIPLYPIHYAPKTAAAFGHTFRGLEILDQPYHLSPKDAPANTASSVVAGWLRDGDASYPLGALGRAEGLAFGALDLFDSALSRLGRNSRGK